MGGREEMTKKCEGDFWTKMKGYTKGYQLDIRPKKSQKHQGSSKYLTFLSLSEKGG